MLLPQLLLELFTGVVCKSHLHIQGVSNISKKPVLLCIKTRLKKQSAEKLNSFPLANLGKDSRDHGSGESSEQQPCYKLTDRDNSSDVKYLPCTLTKFGAESGKGRIYMHLNLYRRGLFSFSKPRIHSTGMLICLSKNICREALSTEDTYLILFSKTTVGVSLLFLKVGLKVLHFNHF